MVADRAGSVFLMSCGCRIVVQSRGLVDEREICDFITELDLAGKCRHYIYMVSRQAL